jgi:tRNA-guanine transglycosylase
MGGKNLVRIDHDGVTFRSHWEGSTHRFTPEISIATQRALGADIMIAFDDCTPLTDDVDLAEESMRRTHAWSGRSREAFLRGKSLYGYRQALYGVVQGGVFQTLREESARTVSALGFDGIAIGGVSVGETKRQMYAVADWVIPLLPEEKPRHMLGVGEIEDIFEIIERGVDTFDCVMPTRLARMGHVLLPGGISHSNRPRSWTYDIQKREYAESPDPLVPGCLCATCRTFSKAYVHHLFRVRELLGYRLTTIHNLYLIQTLMHDIRHAISNGQFRDLKASWLSSKEARGLLSG